MTYCCMHDSKYCLKLLELVKRGHILGIRGDKLGDKWGLMRLWRCKWRFEVELEVHLSVGGGVLVRRSIKDRSTRDRTFIQYHLQELSNEWPERVEPSIDGAISPLLWAPEGSYPPLISRSWISSQIINVVEIASKFAILHSLIKNSICKTGSLQSSLSPYACRCQGTRCQLGRKEEIYSSDTWQGTIWFGKAQNLNGLEVPCTLPSYFYPIVANKPYWYCDTCYMFVMWHMQILSWYSNFLPLHSWFPPRFRSSSV